MNRGSAGQDPARGAAAIASMRPRFMNRGSPRSPESCPAVRALASMRPRFMNRGSINADEGSLDPAIASMRPRFMNRGSDLRAKNAASNGAASMRPRFMNRGSAAMSSKRPPTVTRFNEAPIHESGKSSPPRHWMQWLPAASMRPRFMNRGSKGVASGALRATCSLQ